MVASVAIPCSSLAVTMQNQRKEKAAAEAIEKAGGTVASEPTWLGKFLRDDSLVRVTAVCFFHEPTTDAALVHLEGLSQLENLGLASTQVTNAGLVHLQRLSQLKALWLGSTKVTDAGLLHLQGLSQLEGLQLYNTKVTDQGVKKLQRALPNCKIER
jgi:hypothetical protein